MLPLHSIYSQYITRYGTPAIYISAILYIYKLRILCFCQKKAI